MNLVKHLVNLRVGNKVHMLQAMVQLNFLNFLR